MTIMTAIIILALAPSVLIIGTVLFAVVAASIAKVFDK